VGAAHRAVDFLDPLFFGYTCFERIVIHNILDYLVIINENKTSMAIVEANQLQIPIVSLVDFNIPNI
jgi:hypothetical protein